MGRPRGSGIGITEELVERVASCLRSGNYVLVAFRVCGIPPRVGRVWIEQGKGDHEAGVVSLYSRFYEATEAARAAAEDDLVDMLKAMARKGDSKAAIFLLERRHPGRWGKSEKPKPGTDLTPEQDAAIKAALSERPKGTP